MGQGHGRLGRIPPVFPYLALILGNELLQGSKRYALLRLGARPQGRLIASAGVPGDGHIRHGANAKGDAP
jgi:hypothetical protein